jgi:hypothetical protein
MFPSSIEDLKKWRELTGLQATCAELPLLDIKQLHVVYTYTNA